MLKAIMTLIGFFGQIIARILQRRAKLKPASEILPEQSPTAQAVVEAETKAEEKFGPRLGGRPHQPPKRAVEGIAREVKSRFPKS